MDITIVANPGAPHQVAHQEALLDGLRTHGVNAVKASGGRIRSRYVACWGWYKGRRLRAAGHDVLVMERGYLGDRFKWTSLAWNGLNGHGDFGRQPTDDSRFADNFAPMKPWKDGGDYVLILGQVPGDASLKGQDMHPWYRKAAKDAALHYGLPVRFRPHPLAARRGGNKSVPGAMNSTGTLEEALDGAAVAITYNSNSGVDAVLHGVPTVAMDQGAMAWDVTSHRIGDMCKPLRDRWAANLAWKQWSMDEIRDGTALCGVLEAAGKWLMNLV